MALFVNGEPVDSAWVDNEIARLKPSYEQAFKDQPEEEQQIQLAQWSRENIIESVLFRQEARKALPDIPDNQIQSFLETAVRQEGENGVISQRLQAGPEEVARLRAEAADDIRMEMLRHKLSAEAGKPGQKAVEQYYQSHIERFTIPETLRAAHIVKHPSAELDADEARRQIFAIYEEFSRGVPFEELADQHSDCPGNAGDLGYFTRGKMVPAFEDVVFALEVGAVSEPFETEFGWHIAKLTQRHPAAPCPLEQVRDLIVRELTNAAAEQALEHFIDAAKMKALIEER